MLLASLQRIEKLVRWMFGVNQIGLPTAQWSNSCKIPSCEYVAVSKEKLNGPFYFQNQNCSWHFVAYLGLTEKHVWQMGKIHLKHIIYQAERV